MKKNPAAARGRPRRALIGKLVVFGVGLIGGSFALALKRGRDVAHVVGVGRSRKNLLAARRLGIIDEIATDVISALKGADLVLLAVPLGQTAAVMAKIAPHLDAHTVVSDAGSTKRDVIDHARRYLGDAYPRFVPAHPIAGTEKSGAQAAFAELFQGRNLIIAATPETRPNAVRLVTTAWRRAGMRIVNMRAEDHDRVFALMSHLPHMAAFALVDQIADYADGAKLFGQAGGGFRDTVRIAGSSPEMWRDICLANRDALLSAMDDYLAQLEHLRGLIAARDASAIERAFARARAARARWLLAR